VTLLRPHWNDGKRGNYPRKALFQVGHWLPVKRERFSKQLVLQAHRRTWTIYKLRSVNNLQTHLIWCARSGGTILVAGALQVWQVSILVSTRIPCLHYRNFYAATVCSTKPGIWNVTWLSYCWASLFEYPTRTRHACNIIILQRKQGITTGNDQGQKETEEPRRINWHLGRAWN
jgi:hypothetical protein